MTHVRSQRSESVARPGPRTPLARAAARPASVAMARDLRITHPTGTHNRVRAAVDPTGTGATRDVLDSNGWFAASQTFLQGLARGTALSARTVRSGQALSTVADVLDGHGGTVSSLFTRAGSAISRALTHVAPDLAATVGPALGPVTKAAGSALTLVGKAAPVLNVLAASWDIYKAATERDPAQVPAAVANATLSTGSTALAIGAVVLGATPVGWGLAIGAAAVAGFQLVDNLACHGAGTKWLGDTAASAWSGLKGLFN